MDENDDMDKIFVFGLLFDPHLEKVDEVGD